MLVTSWFLALAPNDSPTSYSLRHVQEPSLEKTNCRNRTYFQAWTCPGQPSRYSNLREEMWLDIILILIPCHALKHVPLLN